MSRWDEVLAADFGGAAAAALTFKSVHPGAGWCFVQDATFSREEICATHDRLLGGIQ